MKKFFKFYSVALAALMAFGSLTFVSCDKENDIVNPQTEQVATKNVNDGAHFPIELQNFTDSNGTTWTVWGGYYELLGRRAIKFDIKFYPTNSPNRVVIRHYVGTVTFDLNGNCEITSGDFRMTTEIKDFLRDFARYYLHY